MCIIFKTSYCVSILVQNSSSFSVLFHLHSLMNMDYTNSMYIGYSKISFVCVSFSCFFFVCGGDICYVLCVTCVYQFVRSKLCVLFSLLFLFFFVWVRKYECIYMVGIKIHIYGSSSCAVGCIVVIIYLL